MQRIPWPVACWVKCLFDRLSILDYGGKWPLKWKFSKIFFPDSLTGHRSTFRDQIWWKSAVTKLPIAWITTQENSRSAGLVPAPILPKMGRSRPKFPERWHPLTCPRRPNLVRIGCALPDLFRKDLLSAQKVNTIYNRLSAYNKKLNCRRETAQRFVSLNILLSQWRCIYNKLWQLVLLIDNPDTGEIVSLACRC